jgi:hypothetical protein
MPTLRRRSAALIPVSLPVVLAALAFAASLTFSGGSLGMASAIVPRCTATGLSVLQNLSGSNVISVTVGTLPSGCGSGTLQVTLNNSVTSSSGSAAVPGAGGSVTVTLGAAIALGAVDEVDLVLTGP